MSKIWFITGSSRGFGRSLAEAVLEKEGRVVATSRNPDHLKYLKQKYQDRIFCLKLDVTQPIEAETAIADAVAHFGRIDVLVNHASYAFLGAVEEQTQEEMRKQIETNLFGVIHVTKAAIPVMRRQRAGHILQFSSVGGRLGVPGLAAYNAAKFGVEGFSEALAREVAPLGIKVTIVEPGGFRTDWSGTSMDYAKSIADYESTVHVLRRIFENGQPPGDPQKAAQVLLKIVDAQDPPLRIALGKDALQIIKKANQFRADEMEKWQTLSASTDFDQSV